MSTEIHAPSRFNMMDLLIALVAATAIITFVLAGRNRSADSGVDVKRVATIQQVSKALALYITKNDTYPPAYSGCITNTDPVSEALYGGRFLQRGGDISDPLYPDDPEKCIYYEGTPSNYRIRYILEASTGAGEPGVYYHIP